MAKSYILYHLRHQGKAQDHTALKISKKVK